MQREKIENDINPASKALPALALVVFAVLLWFYGPKPEALSDIGWHGFVLFITCIGGIILQPLPTSPLVMITFVVGCLTGTFSMGSMLTSAFGNEIMWMICCAFFLAVALIKSQLAIRTAYTFVKLLGKSTLGLAYGLVAAECVLAPAIPSVVARAGGVIYPIAVSLAQERQDEDGADSTGFGKFLVLCCFHISTITSAMFLTAMAGNPIVQDIAFKIAGVDLSWMTWAKAAFLPGLVALITTPLLIFKLVQPTLTHTPEAPAWASQMLSEMGPVSRLEKTVAAIFVVVLGLWLFGENIGIGAPLATMLGVCLMLIFGALTWQQCLEDKTAWDTLFWLSLLVAMGSFLEKQHAVFSTLTQLASPLIAGWAWPFALLAIVLFYFYTHYCFASNSAQITAMYAALFTTAINCGAPALLSALILGFVSSLFGGLTHYSSGPAAIYYGTGYSTLPSWWKIGFIVGTCNLAIFILVGAGWWKVLGLY